MSVSVQSRPAPARIGIGGPVGSGKTALIEKLRGSYRFHLLVKGDRDAADKRRISDAAGRAAGDNRDLTLQFDVDPVNLF